MAIPLLTVLENYKRNTLRSTISPLGDADLVAQQRTTEEIFISRLKSTRSSRFKLVITIIVVLILIILFLGVLIWKHNDNQTYVLSLLGGQGASVFLAVNMMLRLKREELFSSIIIDLLPKAVSKEDKDKIIDTLIQYLKG